MPNIMNKTQRPRVTQKSILYALRKQLLTLSTEFLNKKIELPDHLYLAPINEPGDWPRCFSGYIGFTDALDTYKEGILDK